MILNKSLVRNIDMELLKAKLKKKAFKGFFSASRLNKKFVCC